MPYFASDPDDAASSFMTQNGRVCEFFTRMLIVDEFHVGSAAKTAGLNFDQTFIFTHDWFGNFYQPHFAYFKNRNRFHSCPPHWICFSVFRLVPSSSIRVLSLFSVLRLVPG